jgi:hypothetical protein
VARKKTKNGNGVRFKPGSFYTLPKDLINCKAYTSLGANSIRVLFEFVRIYSGYNNGNLCLTFKELKKRGFKSEHTLYKAKDELLKKGFIVINCYGGYGNRDEDLKYLPHLYAITWHGIDELKKDYRMPHFTPSEEPLKYFIQGENPHYKTKLQSKNEFKKDTEFIKIMKTL